MRLKLISEMYSPLVADLPKQEPKFTDKDPLYKWMNDNNPDHKYKSVSADELCYDSLDPIPILFLPNRTIVYGKPNQLHADLYDDPNLNLADKLKECGLDPDTPDSPVAIANLIYGRIGMYGMIDLNKVQPTDLKRKPNFVQYASFWDNGIRENGKRSQLFIDCLAKLSSDGVISDNTIISTPYETFKYGNQREPAELPDLTPEQKAEQERLREIHLLGPEEKRKALMAMGAKGGVKRPWQRALEQEKVIQPGQKWWAPTSESKK